MRLPDVDAPSGDPGPPDLLVSHAVLITMDTQRRIISDGALAIRDGAIVEIGDTASVSAANPGVRTLDVAGAIVHPGFVDAHTHLSQHLSRSTIPDGWAEAREHDQWLPYWLAMTEEDDHASSLLGAMEMARNGTTAFCDLGGRHRAELTAAAADEVGIRGIVSEICWDHPPHPSVATGDTDACLERIERQLTALPDEPARRVFAGVVLPGMGTCSDELLVGGAELARRHGVVLAFHQSFDEPDTAAYRARTGVPAVEHLEGLGILGPDTTLIHLVRTEASEVERLARTGTNVVHCPAASLRSGVGVSHHGRFPEMVAAGISVALGSDSGNYSDAFDIRMQAFLAATLHGEARGERGLIGALGALEMATIGGAAALGMADRIGSLEVGKRADLVIRDTTSPALHPGLEPVKSLVYGGAGAGVETVLVDGEVIVRDGHLVGLDEGEALAAIDAAARGLFERMDVPELPFGPTPQR